MCCDDVVKTYKLKQSRALDKIACETKYKYYCVLYWISYRALEMYMALVMKS